MLTCSRLKSGAKNVRILESIFILNNILNKLKDNSSNIDEYIDPEDDVNIGVLSILDENIQSRSHNTVDHSANDTELIKERKKRQGILEALKLANKFQH